MLPTDLLLQAQAATPPRCRAGKWAPILPAVEILLARRFSLTDAIGWLVDRHVVPAAGRRSAYYSISQRLRRAAATAGRPPRATRLRAPVPDAGGMPALPAAQTPSPSRHD